MNLPDGRTGLAMSVYPPEAKAWDRSTEYLKDAVERFSVKWYPFPWPNAVNVAGPAGGMEYPALAFDDIDSSLLVDEETSEETAFGTAAHRGLRSGAITRPGAARILLDDAPDELRQTVRFDWAALDAWFEEDEQVFVHPRDPYTRVDALRSNGTLEKLQTEYLANAGAPELK